MNSAPFKTLEKNGDSEHVEKRSRFLGFSGPIASEDAFKETLNAIKKEHHSARHVCFAVRLKNGIERYSDDGEPHRTGGYPALLLLQNEKLVDAYTIVVRYYGGTKLGTGGLARAYREAAHLAILESGVETVVPTEAKTLSIPYDVWESFQYFVQRFDGAEVTSTTFGECVVVQLDIEMKKVTELTDELDERFRSVKLLSE